MAVEQVVWMSKLLEPAVDGMPLLGRTRGLIDDIQWGVRMHRGCGEHGGAAARRYEEVFALPAMRPEMWSAPAVQPIPSPTMPGHQRRRRMEKSREG